MEIRNIILFCFISSAWEVVCADLTPSNVPSNRDIESFNKSSSHQAVATTNKTNIYFSDSDTNSNRVSQNQSQKSTVTYHEKCHANEWFYNGDIGGDYM